jgi:predicted nucleic acid-binding protein
VKAYLDTNVLVAACVETHPHFVPAFELVKMVGTRAIDGCISTHGLAEFYSVMTRAPFNPRVHPADAGKMVESNILPYFELTALAAEDYISVVRSCAEAGFQGALVFDALHLRCAQNAGCDRIYTFNVKDFRNLAPPELAAKIASP